MKSTILLVLIFIGCSSIYNGLTKEKIVFKKDEIGYRTTYSIFIPDFTGRPHEKNLYFSEHGHRFDIIYTDSSTLYYTNDRGMITPNHKNYETINWKGYNIFEGKTDTILNGLQPDGRYWKEIRQGEDYFGYLNIMKDDKELFDTALKTLKE